MKRIALHLCAGHAALLLMLWFATNQRSIIATGPIPGRNEFFLITIAQGQVLATIDRTRRLPMCSLMSGIFHYRIASEAFPAQASLFGGFRYFPYGVQFKIWLPFGVLVAWPFTSWVRAVRHGSQTGDGPQPEA